MAFDRDLRPRQIQVLLGPSWLRRAVRSRSAPLPRSRRVGTRGRGVRPARPEHRGPLPAAGDQHIAFAAEILAATRSRLLPAAPPALCVEQPSVWRTTYRPPRDTRRAQAPRNP